MSKPEYPSIQLQADAAAQTAQRRFLLFTRTHLGLLVAVGVVSSFSPTEASIQCTLAWVVAALMFAALCVSIWLQFRKYDDRWFQCRALAENVKGLAWRYVMGVGSEGGQQTGDPEKAFIAAVDELRQRLSDLASSLALESKPGPLITGWMRDTRTRPFNERLELFRKERIHDQITWYSNKSRWNAHRENVWAGVLFVVEVAAIVTAVIYAQMLGSWNPVGFISTIAAVAVAWTQVKRHSELAKTYKVAADDLTAQDAAFDSVGSEIEVPSFVHQVETAISREHSVWLHQRGVV